MNGSTRKQYSTGQGNYPHSCPNYTVPFNCVTGTAKIVTTLTRKLARGNLTKLTLGEKVGNNSLTIVKVHIIQKESEEERGRGEDREHNREHEKPGFEEQKEFQQTEQSHGEPRIGEHSVCQDKFKKRNR